MTLEADILGSEGFTVEQTGAFAAGRDVEHTDDFVRLYTVEGSMSLTGTNSDYRIRLTPAAQLEFVLSLIHEVGRKLSAKTAQVPAVRDLAIVLRQHRGSREPR